MLLCGTTPHAAARAAPPPLPAAAAAWDYIVVGGGLSGSVVSSRLAQHDPTLSVLLVEAGDDARGAQDILYSNYTPLTTSDWDWTPTTTAQRGLGGRALTLNQGKGLGGGTIINSCGWTRGDRLDYAEWAELVGGGDDGRWAYDNMLEYFKMTEDWWNASSTAQHGVGGPVYVASVASTGREYPLREPVARGWDELGVGALPYLDGNAGRIVGRAELTENRRDGLRQIAASAYHLDQVSLLVNTTVAKLVYDTPAGATPRVSGVKLQNGTVINAAKVIVSAGTLRSPQILMLSGIGPKDDLARLGIDSVLDNKAVGRNLMDHMSLYAYWKLANASAGEALGPANLLFHDAKFGMGYPVDWVVTTSVDRAGLIEAITKDEGKIPDASHPLLQDGRPFLEFFVIYQATKASDPHISYDGTHLFTNVVSFQPTSRGTVKLKSTDIRDQMIIDPNYLSTAVDRYVYRHGVRTLTRLMLNTSLASHFAGETPPDRFPFGFRLNSSDAYIDARVAYSAQTTWHPHGTLSMGKVVDSDFRVKGVENLFVVDSSVLPVAMSAHLMAPLYAMSERAAVIISSLDRKAKGLSNRYKGCGLE